MQIRLLELKVIARSFDVESSKARRSCVGQLGIIRGGIFSSGIKWDLTKHCVFVWRPLLARATMARCCLSLTVLMDRLVCVRVCCVVINAETLLMNYE